MDGGKFDQLARGLSAQRSRRSVVKLLGAAALGAVGVAGFRHEADAAKADKINVCHRTGDPANPYVYISVSANAQSAHESHGDAINPDFTSDSSNCGGCGIVCEMENASATCSSGFCSYTCNDGFVEDCNGNCIPSNGCEVICLDSPACFWMDIGRSLCFTLNGFPAETQEECQALDSCAAGGGGESGGGCYMWSTSSTGPAIAPPW